MHIDPLCAAAMIRTHRASAALPRALAALILALLTLPALAIDDFDRWFVVLLDGQKCGWSHEWQVTEGDRITTSSAMSMAIRRGSTEVKIEMETEFIETDRGEAVSSRSVQSIGSQPVTRELTWVDHSVRIVTTQGDRTGTDTKPAPSEEWLTPAAAAEYVRARLEAGARTIEYRSLDPSEGLTLVSTTMTDFEPDSADVLGRSVEATRCTTTASNAPGIVTRAWVDQNGQAVRTEIPFGGLSLTMVMADQASAMARGEAPELMVETLIRPNRRIDEPRRVRTASYVLSVTAEGVLPALPETSAQSVQNLESDRARVTVDMRDPEAAEVADEGVYLESSSLLDLTDPEIVALKDRTLARASADPAARAEALRRAVYRHIRDKTLGVGFASASEVCRSRAGDCSEHGVLLAALLRADGIPSRVVSGLVYADEFLGEEGIFGFHMWAQALLEVEGEKRWVDLDATLSASVPFDATHIALAVSALDDDSSSSDMASIATLLGTLKVQVERVAR